jgi:UDP-N-acetylmuramate dehydrogenase
VNAVDESKVKTSAAWLIQNAGFDRGFGVHGDDSAATLSSVHTLALTNRGNATSDDIVELARAVREGVREKFGITLEPEPVTVGLTI